MRFWMAALACIALAGNGVRAQEASGKDKEALEDARQHVAKAKVHYDLGEYKDAAEEYIIVYRLKPLPALLFNIAQSYRQAGMYDKARSFYKSYLREAPEVKNRATIEQSIKEMDELLAKEKKAKNGPPTGVKEPMGSTAAEASRPIKKMARAPEKAAAVDAAAAKPLSAPATSAPTAAAQNQPVTQEIAMTVKGNQVSCSINSTVVATFDKSALVTAGKLKSTDGVYGIRFAHNTDGIVSDLKLTKAQ
jgi:tetratricopeptide (TPR) repeat protein